MATTVEVATYRIRPGTPIPASKAEVYGPEIHRLMNEGRGQPEDIVEEARSESSPLHEHFEWDDAKAAHRHRISQARQLLQVIEIRVRTTGDAERDHVRVAHNIRLHGERTYVSIDEIQASEEYQRLLVLQSIEDAERFAARYEHLDYLYGDAFAVFKRARRIIDNGEDAPPSQPEAGH